MSKSINSLPENVIKVHDSLLKQKESGFQSSLDDITHFILPTYEKSGVRELQKDDDADKRPIASVAISAAKKLGGNLCSYTYAQGDQNFSLRLSSEAVANAELEAWLQKAGATAQRFIQQSNFAEVYGDLCMLLPNYGSGCASVQWDAKSGELLFRNYPINGGVYFLEDARGRVDGLLRVLKLTAPQCVEMFQGYPLPPEINEAMQNGRVTQRFDILHLVDRNPDFKEGSDGSFKYRSIYVAKNARTLIKNDNGFQLFPYFCPRWTRVHDSLPYGQGAGHDAMPTVKAINNAEALLEDAVEHEAFPTGFLNDQDAVQQAKYVPRTFNFADMSNGGPVFVNPTSNAAAMGARVQMLEERIREQFYNDVFFGLSTNPRSGRTEDEIQAIQNEKIAVLEPMVARLRSEFWAPMVKRVVTILVEKGILLPPPAEFDDKDVQISYTSRIDSQFDAIMASRTTQALQEAHAIMMMGAENPALGEVAKLRDAATNLLKARNVDMDLIVTEQEQREIDQAKQAEAQRAAELQEREMRAKEMKPVDPQAPVSPDSVMGQMIQPQAR